MEGIIVQSEKAREDKASLKHTLQGITRSSIASEEERLSVVGISSHAFSSF